MDSVKLHYEVSGDDFTRAGEASGDVKRVLKELGFDPDVVRNVSIAMYEGEINIDRKSTRLNSSHRCTSRMPSSA